ncbi:MAG: hypothetical protein QXU92_03500 [Candidatus Diapherotrites archaeon]
MSFRFLGFISFILLISLVSGEATQEESLNYCSAKSNGSCLFSSAFFSSAVCTSSELPDNDSQNILDLLKEGFTTKEIVGETDKEKERKSLDAKEIVILDPNNKDKAAKVEVPSEKFLPSEVSQFLNSNISGPFAFGVVLEDSLRVGKCKDPASLECTLTGKNLKYRNSGSGIVADLKPLKEAVTEVFWDKWVNGDEKLNGLSKEENEVLRLSAVENLDDPAKVKLAKRLEKELIPNSMLSNSFEARLQTNCNNDSCVISIYSFFDKYFNSWLSTEMVVSSFGPSLLFQTKKLFGWTGRRGFLSGIKEGYQEFLDNFRVKYLTPESYLYNKKRKNIQRLLNKYDGWKEWWQQSVAGSADGSGYYLFKTEEFEDWWAKAQEHGGLLSKIKTAEERKDFLNLLYDARSLMRTGKAMVDQKKAEWQKALKLAGNNMNDPIVKEKYIEYGKAMITFMDDYYDEALGADFIEWVNRYHYVGLFDKGFKIIYPSGDGEIFDFFRDHRNLRNILRKLKNEGTFANFSDPIYRAKYGAVYETRGDNLVLYTIDPNSPKRAAGLSWSNIANAAPHGTQVQQAIMDDTGRMIPYNSSSAKFIQNRLSTNAVVHETKWIEYGELSPVDMIARIDTGRTGSTANLRMAVYNFQTMIDTLQERNWVSRKYWNALDKILAQEDELVRSYFASVKGGAKLTTLPFAYWWAKKGFGEEGISMYQLPETWHDLKITLGSEPIYDYSYIDFFANEGSDMGDIFIQIINSLPWKLILDELSEKYNPMKNLYNALTQNELRSEVENLAIYTTSPNDCVGCNMVISSQTNNEFRPFFFIENGGTNSYILEDTYSQKAREKGQTLIIFAGKTNLVGESGGKNGEEINLAKALTDEKIKTCKEAIESLKFMGISWGKLYNSLTPEFSKKDPAIGFFLGGLESVGYGFFFGAGIFSTAAIQLAIVPQLQDCVDTEEGYYAHYFVPVKEEKDEKTNTSQKSTEKVSKLVDSFRERLVESFESDTENPVSDAAKDLGKELEKFTKNARKNDLVQATLKTDGLTSGQLRSRELFYVWAGKGSQITPTKYKEDGSETLKGTNDQEVKIDFEKGEIKAGDKLLSSSPDHTRLASTNLNIPATEIPHTITETCISDMSKNVFEITSSGSVKIINPEALECLRKGVFEQTGLTLQTDTLNDAFGKLESIVTSTHPNVKTLGDKIIAEGTPRKVAEGKNEKVIVLPDFEVELSKSNDGEKRIGKLQSLQFANGVIVMKPNGCFITWLKHHEKGILNKEDIKGIQTNLSRELNNETLCEEPAVNFKLIPDSASDLKASNVENFNKSLEKLGPFKVFETPTKRYIISSILTPEGKCQDHLRIIDKETGKITDYFGEITQTPNGLKIRTEDGKEHELKFSEKEGAPLIQLDNEKPELLTAAQGKNGSFYYDPEKGLWFAENAQLLPLIEAFREGLSARVSPTGEVTATAQGNVLNLDLGKKDNDIFNLPTLPEQKVAILLLFSVLVISFIMLQSKANYK